MNKTVLMTGLALAIGLGALSEVRAQGMGDGQGMQGHGMMRDGMPGMSREDIAARFEEADGDGDGKLSREEIVARMTERATARIDSHADRMIAHHDGDGDGMLTMDELRAGPAGRMFDRLDADGDGTISREEFRKMREMRQAMGEDGRKMGAMHDRHGKGRGHGAADGQPGVIIHQHFHSGD